MNSEVLLGFSKHAFSEKITSDFENRPFRHFSMELGAFCDQLMQVYIALTPLMIFRNSKFIPFLISSGLKKRLIILGNKIKVKTNFWILITFIFTYIHSVNLAMCFKFVILRNVIFRDFSKSCQFLSKCILRCALWTVYNRVFKQY